MTTPVIKTTFQLHRGLSEAWTRNNPILAAGEPGFELDTYRLKIGNGSTPWQELAYLNGNGGTGVLRRDSADNYDPDYIPLKGEVLLVDVPGAGLCVKIGDGTSTFSELSYIDTTIASTPLVFKGIAANSAAITGLTDYKTGWTYKASSAFTIDGVGTVENGDMIIAINDYDSAYSALDWTIIQNNIDTMIGATSSEAGVRGLVPAPAASADTRYLDSTGNWSVPATPIYYGVCETASSVREKTVTIPGVTSLYNGLHIAVRFVNKDTSTYHDTSVPLNVNNLGAKEMRLTLSDASHGAGSTEITGSWEPGEIREFIYDTNFWIHVDTVPYATTSRLGTVDLIDNIADALPYHGPSVLTSKASKDALEAATATGWTAL